MNEIKILDLIRQEKAKIKRMSHRKRYCFRCGKDRMDFLVGMGKNWYWNPENKRSFCDTFVCKVDLERGWCDECQKKIEGQKYYSGVEADYHLECYKKYRKIARF